MIFATLPAFSAISAPARARALPALLALAFAASPRADVTCEWRGRMAVLPADPPGCLQAGPEVTTVTLPANADRIAPDGFALCREALAPGKRGADVVFVMDNSGSMEKGENSAGFSTDPGDPFGIRDRVLRNGIRQLRGAADTATAGFLSFYGLGPSQDYREEPEIEVKKLQPPLDISRSLAEGEANLTTVLRKVWKHLPSEAVGAKASAASPAREAKKALTFWSESLARVQGWFRPESGFVKTGNPAIVLLSDGAIGDWAEVQQLVPGLPPVYGIHLGVAAQARHMEDLAALTKGRFYLVMPTDTARFRQVMGEIIARITGFPSLSGPAQVLVPGRAAAVGGLEFGEDGNLVLRLPAPLALARGANDIQVAWGADTLTGKAYGSRLAVSTTGPALVASQAHFTCADPLSLGPVPGRGGARDTRGKGGPARDALGKSRPAGPVDRAAVRLFPGGRPGR